nr:MAG: hypothetical protein [Molluscum contagiosum virus]
MAAAALRPWRGPVAIFIRRSASLRLRRTRMWSSSSRRDSDRQRRGGSPYTCSLPE